MATSKKLTGCCTDCDKSIFEVLSHWPMEHPFAGEPRQIDWQKLADPEAVKIVFMMSDGSTCDMSFCGKCAETADAGVVKWWKKNIAAQDVEERNRAILGGPRIDESRVEAHRRSLLKTANMVPLGALYRQKWKDLMNA